MLAREYDSYNPPADYCEIRVRGHLASRWSQWFDGLALSYTESGQTILCGPVKDESAVRGLLAKALDLNLTIVSMSWIEQGAIHSREA
jgi:hypothetical protein